MSSAGSTPSILAEIVAHKRQEVAARKTARPLQQLESQLAAAPPTRGFLQRLAQPGEVHLIAEVKKASPSRGVIRQEFDPVGIARIYATEGAACISVLTDEKYFQGRLEYLEQIRKAVAVPLLRKDFIVDVYQLYEARLAGADAVLLIAECLDQPALSFLFTETVRLGMVPLVELHDPSHLPRVLDLGASLIGINNRNLHTFTVDLEHAIRLRERIPPDRVVVAESGIRSRQDFQRLARAGINAVLVGESLMSASDIAEAVRQLLGRSSDQDKKVASKNC